MSYDLFFFRRFWVKEPRHSENISDEKKGYLYRSPPQVTQVARSTVAPQTFFNEIAGVLKPAPGRISWNTMPRATSMSSFDSPLQPRIYIKIFSSLHHSSCRAVHETFVKENRLFGEGAIVESVKRAKKKKKMA